MSWQEEYEAKQISLDRLFQEHITGGQKIFFGGLHAPTTIINAMIDRIMEGKLSGIQMWANWINGEVKFGEMKGITSDQFRYHTYFAGPNERAGMAAGVCSYVPCHFGDVWRMIEESQMDYTIVQMTPPDANGYCNVGPLGFVPGGVRTAKHVIASINPRLPRVFGDSHDYHVSQIDAFLLIEDELEDEPVPEPTREEMLVAEQVVARISDGDCIQIGIGGISNAICRGLESMQHLGCFTEMYSDALVTLQEKGVIDNSRNTYFKGKSVGGYSTGTQRLYDYINENPEVYYTSYNVVTNPYEIAKNDNLMSINTAVSIDLTGQVCAESIGPRQYSASGGQFNYVQGAKMAKGGKSFIAVTSLAHTKKGDVSKIVPMLAQGSAITSLRNEVQYIVTEYGVADLRWADIDTRAKRLIEIAHPDFRDELRFEAKRLGMIL